MRALVDKKYLTARNWSNSELKKFAHLFRGRVLNVSGWKDQDKQGNYYKNYFKNSDKYEISNYKSEACGFQGQKGEFYLDLTEELPDNLINKYDVVFNHTTLEHIYDVRTAFQNICLMSKDIVILVVPFLQQMHSLYGDYWRFTPLTIKKMFEDETMEVLYSSFNEGKGESVYLFFIASKKPEKWRNIIHNEFSFKATKKCFLDFNEQFTGNRAISNTLLLRVLYNLKQFLK